MEKQNISTYNELESYFIQQIINNVNNLNSKSIVWEEVFSNGVTLPLDTVIQVWKDDWHRVLEAVRFNEILIILKHLSLINNFIYR